MTTRLQRRLEALYGLERRKDKLGLDGTLTLLGALGDPHTRFRSVHVAGTNGKGSVCALVERVLREAGYRTGLYTSPHLVDFRERIRVGGRWADQAWLERALDRIEALPQGKDRTFFEVATALGFLYFAELEVEIAVVEVGLGGRLDCTNVITPEVSVITSIGLDHTEILGATLEAIAAEKAGIAKRGVPLVLASQLVAPVRTVFEAVARERGAPMVEAAGYEDQAETSPGFQAPNAACARAALDVLARGGFEIPEQALRDGFQHARWPGRLEPAASEPRLWWDGAHNLQAMRALVRVWRASGRPAPAALAIAVSRDKPIGEMLAILHELTGNVPLMATRSTSGRALEPELIVAAARDAGFRAMSAADVPLACAMAVASASVDRPALLTGSLFAVGEAMEVFGGAPGEQL